LATSGCPACEDAVTESLTTRVEALQEVPLFADLSLWSLERIARVATEVDIPAGQLLIEPRAKGSGMFLIQEGTVTVHVIGKRLQELGPGEVVGELALLRRDGARSARVQAKTNVRCLAIDRDSFRKLLAEEPKLALAILEVVVERLSTD
jgi:CRP-like cAMP-binding protein